jgi:hypothetical protein
MFKMGSHVPFEYSKYKNGQKKGWESKCQFDSQPLKIWNRLDLLTCRWHVTYYWKALDEGYKFSLNLNSIEGLKKNYEPPKLQKSQF